MRKTRGGLLNARPLIDALEAVLDVLLRHLDGVGVRADSLKRGGREWQEWQRGIRLGLGFRLELAKRPRRWRLSLKQEHSNG